MAWLPISGTVPQYEASGSGALDYQLKFYAAGTTTAIVMATDTTGGTTLAKAALDSEGYPLNGSSARFIPHINRKYRIVLYANATDADANTLANAIFDVNNLSIEDHLNVASYELGSQAAAGSHTGVSTGFLIKTDFHDTNRADNSGGTFRFTGTTDANDAGNWPFSDGYFYDADGKQFDLLGVSVCPRQFGALGDDSADDTNAIDRALVLGKYVKASKGIYQTTGGHVISQYGQRFEGAGTHDALNTTTKSGTLFKRRSGTTTMFRINTTLSSCYIGHMSFDGNSLAGVLLHTGGHNTLHEHLQFRGNTSTDYALYLDGVNLSKFDSITFMAGIFGGMLFAADTTTYGALYSQFDNITHDSDLSGAGFNIKIADSQSLTFNNTYSHRTFIQDTVTAIDFNGLSGETDSTSIPFFEVNGTGGGGAIESIHVNGGKVQTLTGSEARTEGLFKIISCKNWTLKDFRIEDAFGNVNVVYVSMDDVTGFAIEDITLKNNTAAAPRSDAVSHRFINAQSTNRPDAGRVKGINKVTGTIVMDPYFGSTTFEEVHMPIAFSSVANSQYPTLINCDDTINLDNVSNGATLVSCVGAITDANRLATRHGVDGIISRVGANITAANELVLKGTANNSFTGQIYNIAGATAITSISAASSIKGREVTLVFLSNPVFTDGNNLKLAGGANFNTSADDVLKLVCPDGSNWHEISRSAN